MRVLRGLSTALSRIEGTILVAFLTTMLVMAFLQVVLRNVFSTGILWLDPFLRHIVLWIGFLGASLAVQQEKHISIDILTRYVSRRVVDGIRVVTNAFASVVCYFLAAAALRFLQSEIEGKEVLLAIGGLDLQAWWFQLIIPVGFALMSFRFLLRTVEHLVAVVRPTRDPRQPSPPMQHE